MAGEVTRVIKRKRVKFEGATVNAAVDVPVIVQITFQDDSDRGWESRYTIDNSSQGDRNVHVATVTGDRTDETGEKNGLKVERVDVLRVIDGSDRGQETFFAPDSRTVSQPPDAPPYFTTHQKTHIVRYLNTPDDGIYIDSELIDEFRFNDPNDRGQDTYIILNNPPNNQDIDGITIGDQVDDGNGNQIYTIQVDPKLPDISDSDNGIDPPWRLDPFQNIVRYSTFDFLFTFAKFFGALPVLADGCEGVAYRSLNGIDWEQTTNVPVAPDTIHTYPLVTYVKSNGPFYNPPFPPGTGNLYWDIVDAGPPESWPPAFFLDETMNFTSSEDVAKALFDAGGGVPPGTVPGSGPIAAWASSNSEDLGAVLKIVYDQIDHFISRNGQIGYGTNVWFSTSVSETFVPDSSPPPFVEGTTFHIYKSIDGANTWSSEIFSHHGHPTPIGHVRVSPSDPDDPDAKPNSVYVGCTNEFTGEADGEDLPIKFFISTDGAGNNWDASSQTFNFAQPRINSVNNVLFAFGYGALLRSEDGVTWDDLTSQLGLIETDEEGQEYIGGVAYGSKLNKSDNPDNPAPLYALVTSLRCFTSNDGKTWSESGSLPGGGSLGFLSGAGLAASADVLVAAYTTDSTTSLSVARSEDGGATWHEIALPSIGPGGGTVDAVLYSHGVFAAAGMAGASHGFICTSEDGKEWKQVIDVPNDPFSCFVTGAALGRLKKLPAPAGN